MKKWGGLQHIGEHCSIIPGTKILDPAYVWLGDNVHFSACALIGHDGSIAMLNRAFNTSLEAVGPIIIHDNVFIGYGAVILPGVTIGANSIIAAGAVVSKDVLENSVVGGVPARKIRGTDELVKQYESDLESLPWSGLIRERGVKGYDERLEAELISQRVAHFFGKDKSSRETP
ncbi:acyltransferase [Quadrisphaera setariae]|uniref:acyltransferase n=1 Tax=Quadrisphaera setariae TaxID=2593304 RepID=UPI0021062C39|nr:acyltransferase [Quadrisphaera setariae]